MSFLTKRNPSLLNSPLEQIAELAKRKQAFRDLLLNGDSISNAKTYFDNHLLPYLRDVFYLPASQEDFYTRALSLDPSSIELAIRLLRHAARFGQDEIVLLRFFDLFENDSRYLTMHFDFSHSSSQIDSSGLAFAEDLFKVYDSIGYLVPGLFAAHEIARVYYELYRDSLAAGDAFGVSQYSKKVMQYLPVFADPSLLENARSEFRNVSGV